APSADSALPRPVTRSMGAALCALLAAHYFWLARLPAWLRDETSAELASRTSAVLSTTWHGLPWYGLTYAWGTCAFAWLVRALVVDAWPRLTPPRLHAAGPGLGLAALVLTLGLGALAVLGYATGSPWLWPG
ncbi:MAG TPA: hypothetical protein VLC09_13460, partial [Polyangiaceae bacterium]|nr:hypothetical protein [Polyangiaceae bacterium]